jgi:hypothetical protein
MAMTDDGAASEAPPVGLIPIHFDVPGHYLPLATFIKTANQTRAVIDGINREVFDGRLQFEVFVLPAEDGSFKTKLGVALLAGWGVVWSFSESDIGKAFIKGLTTHEPAYWAEAAGRMIKEKLAAPAPSPAGNPAVPARRSHECQTEAVIIAEAAKSFLQADHSQLRRIGITTQKFRDAFEARNGFYQACTADSKVRALGFNDTEDFPIKRKDFARLIVPLAPREDQPLAHPWQVEIVILKVTSPNWDRDDRQRQWKARDDKGRDRYFTIDDEQFWTLVQAQKLNPHIIDTVKVQWAYIGEQRRSARVLRVLEYNGEELGQPLDENALAAILGTYDETPDDHGDLFGGLSPR